MHSKKNYKFSISLNRKKTHIKSMGAEHIDVRYKAIGY